jgi:hypothetical protein
MRYLPYYLVVLLYLPGCVAGVWYTHDPTAGTVRIDRIDGPVVYTLCSNWPSSRTCTDAYLYVNPPGRYPHVCDTSNTVSNGGSVGCPTVADMKSTTCANESDALAKMNALFGGRTLRQYSNYPYNEGRGYVTCAVGDGVGFYYINGGGGAPAPITCSADDTEMAMSGDMGSLLTSTSELTVRCTRRADIRLSISKEGSVDVGGGGVVQLTFQENGSDVLSTNSDNPVVMIKGELTKSPTSAGLYVGSAVLRLDIL